MNALVVPGALVLSCALVAAAGLLLGQAAAAVGWQVIPAVGGFGAFIAAAVTMAMFARSSGAPRLPRRPWR